MVFFGRKCNLPVKRNILFSTNERQFRFSLVSFNKNEKGNDTNEIAFITFQKRSNSKNVDRL